MQVISVIGTVIIQISFYIYKFIIYVKFYKRNCKSRHQTESSQLAFCKRHCLEITRQKFKLSLWIQVSGLPTVSLNSRQEDQ